MMYNYIIASEDVKDKNKPQNPKNNYSKGIVMDYFIITEPMLANAYWATQYAQGIKAEVQRNKGRLISVTPDKLDSVLQYASASRTRPTTLVNCISRQWTASCFSSLNRAQVHPLFIAPQHTSPSAQASAVSFDFPQVFYSLCQYLWHCGRKRCALFGVNPASVNDSSKKEAYLQFLLDYSNPNAKGIFYNDGCLEDCCNAFFQRLSQFDAVICTNDIVAIKLIHFLKKQGVRVPDDLYVAAMGNTSLSQLLSPSITLALFDCVNIGKQAVKLYRTLVKNPEISSLTAKVTGRIIPRESTAFQELPFAAKDISIPSTSRYNQFYSDKDVQDIFSAEKLVSGCDEMDFKILNGLLCDKSLQELERELYTTQNTIKYRMKRMKKLTGSASRKDLLDLFLTIFY